MSPETQAEIHQQTPVEVIDKSEGPFKVLVRRIGEVAANPLISEEIMRDAGVVRGSQSEAVNNRLATNPDTHLPEDFTQDQIALANHRAIDQKL